MLLSHTTCDLPEGCISDLVFDAWHARELDEARAQMIERHLAGCERCAARQRLFRCDAQRYLERADYAPRLLHLSEQLARRRTRRWLGPALLAAAAVLALALQIDSPAPGTRLKGSGAIGFYVRRGEALFRGQPGQHVQPRDRLRFTWRSDAPAYLAILSVDDKRVISTYYPPGNDAQRPLPGGSEIELPSAVELDRTLGRERVFAVSCREPPAVAALRRKLAERGDLRAPPGCHVESFELFKESPP